MKGGRKRVVQSEEGGGGGGGGEKEKKRGGSGNQIVESEGLEEKKKEEGEEEEEDEEEDEEEEEEGEEGKEEENDDGKEEERTKLDDGFFEIEAIRRKRVRKGQLQYLIKWRGWPETANTWEPLENLQSCSDVIDAFEESLRLGKHNRKRKRKYGGPHIQSKKKQPRSSASTYNATGLEVNVVDKSPLVPLDNSDVATLSASSPLTVPVREGESNGNAKNVKKSNRVKENGSTNGSKQIEERKDENDYDTKLSELKGAISSNGVNADKLAIRFQGGTASEGDGLANGLPKVDHVKSVQSDRRIGAKRRKSGSVKRFKQDQSPSGSNLTQTATPNIHVGYGITDAQIGIENLGFSADGLSHRHLIDNSVNVPVITKILKPVVFSASVSDNTQDVSVTFLAIRSDGKEVMVDNRYLKANNPLLLINFYEQHLKYSPPS
ncbi:chromo domain-containing protein LHP1 isoform X2 [Durio zibethinus]|uniref:Chromo domain-containing protein LHP1 isoform X2 n=1 Tax=Durio zibethinus TaxID=66656 RepID=A0A6P5WS73_DURZI|nr:chromo domain-containing protein LHP1 isoform X2 [Durio zibethinus]